MLAVVHQHDVFATTFDKSCVGVGVGHAAHLISYYAFESVGAPVPPTNPADHLLDPVAIPAMAGGPNGGRSFRGRPAETKGVATGADA